MESVKQLKASMQLAEMRAKSNTSEANILIFEQAKAAYEAVVSQISEASAKTENPKIEQVSGDSQNPAVPEDIAQTGDASGEPQEPSTTAESSDAAGEPEKKTDLDAQAEK